MDFNRLDSDIQVNEFFQSKIYSKRAIWGFSIFFSPIFGGFLLRQNLLDIGKKKEANQVLFVAFLGSLFTVLVSIAFEYYFGENKIPTWPLNIPGALVLSEIFFKKHFSNQEFDNKPIWKPLIFSILIILPFIVAIYFNTIKQ